LGTRAKIYEDNQVEGMNLYRKPAGDLNQDQERGRIERANQKLYDRYMGEWAVEDLVSESEDERF
jgi:hypothetical protein